jgi:hypothetical protein
MTQSMANFTLRSGKFGNGAKKFLRDQKNEKTVLFLNAMSGTGKSTTVHKITAYCQSQGWTCIVLSADTAPGATVAQKHEWCQTQLKKATVDIVIIDNTNLGADTQGYLNQTSRTPLMFALRLTELDLYGRLRDTRCFAQIRDKISRRDVTSFSLMFDHSTKLLEDELKNPEPWNKDSRLWLFSGEKEEIKQRIFRIVAAFFLNRHNVRSLRWLDNSSSKSAR